MMMNKVTLSSAGLKDTEYFLGGLIYIVKPSLSIYAL